MSRARISRIIIHPLHGPRWADDRVTDAFADELASLLTQLVVIDSVNPSLVPGGAGEAELARFVANWFKRHGIEATLEDVATGRPNVIAVAGGRRPGRTVILNAHLDTVGVAAMNQPFSAAIESGRLLDRHSFPTRRASD